MGMRFRKSVKLTPGVRINFSKSGISTTVGPRGASVNLSSKGVYANAGIPGTGLYMREKIDGAKAGTRASQAGSPATIQVGQENADSLNVELNQILNIHSLTPAPDDILEFPHIDADDMYDDPPSAKKPHLVNVICIACLSFLIMFIVPPLGTVVGLGLLVVTPFQYSKMKKKYAEALSALDAYEKQKEEFIIQQQAAEKEFEDMLSHERERADDILAYALSGIEWPRETFVSYEVDDETAVFDVDLPEIEDMVNTQFEPTASGKSIREKSLSDTRVRQDYARHVHGIGFRVIGEAFRALDFLETVVVSGYTQRPDAATGNQKDDYLYSVRATREKWEKINFDNLANIDPVEALGAMEIRRDMTKTGIFKAIEPFGKQ